MSEVAVVAEMHQQLQKQETHQQLQQPEIMHKQLQQLLAELKQLQQLWKASGNMALFDATLEAYRHSLGWAFRHQTAVLIVAAATFVGTIGLYLAVPKGFLPRQDTGVIVATTVEPLSLDVMLESTWAWSRICAKGFDR